MCVLYIWVCLLFLSYIIDGLLSKGEIVFFAFVLRFSYFWLLWILWVQSLCCGQVFLSLLLLLSCTYGFICFRASDRLKNVSSKYLPWNAVAPRAFKSSSISTEAVRESKVSKEYGSEQIQVNSLPWWTCNNWTVLLHSSVWNISSPLAVTMFF